MKIDLAPCRPEYAEKFLEWRADPVSLRFNPLNPLDLGGARENLLRSAHNLKELADHENFRWFIEVDGEPGGHVSLKNINLMMKTAEIGYAVHPSLRGKGIATRALRIAVDRIFKETDLRKLIAMIHEENIASRKLAENLGFKLEGVLREQFLIQGRAANEAFYGLLRSDWT